MKAIGKFFKSILIGVWAVIAIFSTICLIEINEYNVSEFGDSSLFAVDNKTLLPDFEKNDIVIVTKDPESMYKVGDKVFFYYNNANTRSFINYGEITNIDVNANAQDTFYFGETAVSYNDIVGAGNGAMVIHKLGMALRLLESRWGFMFLVILPTLFAVVYEIYDIVYEYKKEAKKEAQKETKDEE